MNFRRSAVIMLVAFILLGAASHGLRPSRLPAGSMPSRKAGRSKSFAVSLHSPFASRGATLSPFAPWKSRIKSVLAETYERINEETDFGLVIIPGQLFASGTSELVSCPLPIRLPLRC